jgi:hypothetical protein
MRRLVHGAVSCLALAVLVVNAGLIAAAQGGQVTEGPSISLDRSAVGPGERVIVTLDGFKGTAVTISVCGNQARRGSVDCNTTASEGLGLDRDGSSTVAQLPVAAPPLPCPCLIRAATTNFDEVAVAPIELIGHPVGPVVGASTEEPLLVEVSARRAPHGLVANLRALLGGPTAYDVSVSVRNRSTETLDHVVLAGSAGRGHDDEVAQLELPSLGPLAPGQTWAGEVRATVPAPVVGEFVWQVTASGAGSSVRGEMPTRALPVGLGVLLVVLIGDIGVMLWRRVARRRTAAAAMSAAPALTSARH